MLMSGQGQPSSTQPQEPGLIPERTGLESLAPLNVVTIIPVRHAMLPLSSALVRKPRFIVKDYWKHDLFRLNVVNISSCDHCFGSANRPFTMSMSQQDGCVMAFHRPLRLQSGIKGCFCGCLGQEMEIEAPPGRRIAFISEDFSMWGTSFTITDARGNAMFKVLGPVLSTSCLSKASPDILQVTTMGGFPVGEIWIGEQITVSFLVNLDVQLKGCLIACGMLAVFMFDRDWCITHACCEALLILYAYVRSQRRWLRRQ
ncbi:phospholipid scramblase 2-like isoform X2 [Ornithodoros turicata]|uniref:phospholipid scramblase 2-like isoform X2 n=1 Tax=Ornithodoros turicata TaxID=34597 RepID=UPI003139B992